MSQTTVPPTDALPTGDALAFAPIHKRHFGTAIGATAALAVFVATILDLVLHEEENQGLWLLSQFFTGYGVSVQGAFIGAAWAFGVGWIMGWFVAFCRNFVIAVLVFWARAKANLAASRDFLDHI